MTAVMTDRTEDSGPPRPCRVLVYGSCVARDTLEHVDSRDFALSAYVARQSLISAVAPADPALLDGARLESRFQRRMLEGDARSSLWDVLDGHAAETDLVLCDLTDERLGVYLLPDGSCVTRSVELVRSGVEDRVADVGRLLPFGSDEHFLLWRDALSDFAERLQQLSLRDRVLFLLLPWASNDTDGHDAVESFGTTPAEANRLYGRYEDEVRALFPGQALSLDPGAVRADADHRWGSAPFHFDAVTYASVASMVTTWARERGMIHEAAATGRAPTASSVPDRRAVPFAFAPELRKVGSDSLEVQAPHDEHFTVAFHLYRGPTRVLMVPYVRAEEVLFDHLETGRYRCRVFLHDRRTGERHARTTSWVEIL